MAPRYPQPIAAALMLLAGCASAVDAPSLAPRAIERRYSNLPTPTGPCAGAETSDGCYQPEPSPPPPPAADDPALRARVADLSAQARKGEADFDALLQATAAAVNRAGESGSDSWIEAQQALSRLEAARSQTLYAVNTLDALSLERAGQATSPADLRAIADAAAEARRIGDAQQAALQPLKARLSPS